MRSSNAPQTIASDTAAKANSNRNLAEMGTLLKASEAKTLLVFSGVTFRNQPLEPAKPEPLPKAMAKPTAQKTIPEMAMLTRIFQAMCPAFLAREKPTSSVKKPACMKKTRNVASITQTVSTATDSGVGVPPCAIASAGSVSETSMAATAKAANRDSLR